MTIVQNLWIFDWYYSIISKLNRLVTALNQWVKQQYDHSFLKAGPRMAIPLLLYFLNYTIGRKLLNDGNQTADFYCRELLLNHLNQSHCPDDNSLFQTKRFQPKKIIFLLSNPIKLGPLLLNYLMIVYL